jgi:hypothetical protein
VIVGGYVSVAGGRPPSAHWRRGYGREREEDFYAEASGNKSLNPPERSPVHTKCQYPIDFSNYVDNQKFNK